MVTPSKINLNTCDREPIHLIGAVQPHGALIAVNADSFIIEYASVNSALFLGLRPEDFLGKDLTHLIGAANSTQLRSFPARNLCRW